MIPVWQLQAARVLLDWWVHRHLLTLAALICSFLNRSSGIISTSLAFSIWRDQHQTHTDTHRHSWSVSANGNIWTLQKWSNRNMSPVMTVLKRCSFSVWNSPYAFVHPPGSAGPLRIPAETWLKTPTFTERRMEINDEISWKSHKHLDQGSMWSGSLVSVFMVLSHRAQLSAGHSACWRGGGLTWFWVRVSTWIASVHVHTWHTNTGCPPTTWLFYFMII